MACMMMILGGMFLVKLNRKVLCKTNPKDAVTNPVDVSNRKTFVLNHHVFESYMNYEVDNWDVNPVEKVHTQFLKRLIA